MHEVAKMQRTPEKRLKSTFLAFVFTDCTEQHITRPENRRRRKKTYYSGKKKRHTVKTQLTVNSQGVIIHKTGHKKGKRHDYGIYKKNHPVTPKQVVSVFDLGYLGVGKVSRATIVPAKQKNEKPKRSVS